MANTPVLTDLDLEFKGNDIEIYPHPLPDLFVHAPVLAATHFTTVGDPLDSVLIHGFNPCDEKEEIVAKAVHTPRLPVDKIFVKQKIDLLTAQTWVTDDEKTKRQVIRASIEHSMPSQYTSLIAFETRQEDLKKRGLLDENNTTDDGDSIVKSKAWATLRNNKGTVAALALGGTAITVATTAATFGDVQATFDNIPVLDSGFNGDFHNDCCGGNCDSCGCHGCECGGDANCSIM